MSPVTLYAIGLGTAGLTTFATWQVRRAYASALIDALRQGRPQVFPTRTDEEPFNGRQVDATAVTAVMAGVSDLDVRIRRAAVELLGGLPGREGARALETAVHDPDVMVRAAALRSLARAGNASSLPVVHGAVADPEPSVRLAAIRAIGLLGTPDADTIDIIRGMLGDREPAVRAAASSIILRTAPGEEAVAVLRTMMIEDPEARELAFRAAEGSDLPEIFEMCVLGLRDPSPRVRAAAARAVPPSEPGRAIPMLVSSLGDVDNDVREAVALALGQMGSPAVDPVLAALFDPDLAQGALLLLERLPTDPMHMRCCAAMRERRRPALCPTSTCPGPSILRTAKRRDCSATRCSSELGTTRSMPSEPQRSSTKGDG